MKKTVKTISNCKIYECLVPYSEDIEFIVSLNGILQKTMNIN